MLLGLGEVGPTEEYRILWVFKAMLSFLVIVCIESWTLQDLPLTGGSVAASEVSKAPCAW